jgi:hypothetical protein
MGQVAVQTRAAVGGVQPFNAGLASMTSASNTAAGAMSRQTAIGTALRENVRSMIFPIGGMIGALNEAAFMSGRVADMQEAHSAAQAEVTRLTELGLEGTTQYNNAQKELEKSTRALNFTQRIATQSWFDVVFFMGSLVGAATGLADRYSELRKGTGMLAGASKGLGSIIKTGVTAPFTKLVDTLTGTTVHFTKTNNASKALVRGMSPLEGIVGKNTRSFDAQIGSMSKMATGAGVLGGALAALGSAAAVAAASFVAGLAITAVWRKEFTGASESMVQSVIDMGLAGEDLKVQQEAVRDSLNGLADTIFGIIPGYDEWRKQQDGVTDSSGKAKKEIVGVADAANVVGVAVDGTLQPLNDLAQYNLNAGATAGQLLEKAGLLGAGMKVLGTEMTLSGDQAVYLAQAWLQNGAASAKATQEAYNLVLSHKDFNEVAKMTIPEVVKLAAELEAQGLKAKETEVATREMTAAQIIATDAAAYETEQITSLSMETERLQQSNLEIIGVLQTQGTEFNRLSVGIAATEQGMVEFRDSQAQAYSDIVKNAEALGFQGEAYKATTGELLSYTASAQQTNDINQEGVDTWLTLSDSTRQALASYGLTAQMMGNVAEGTQDLTERQSTLIQVMSGVEDANAKNIDGMIELVNAGEDVNRVVGLTNEQIAEELRVLEASGEAHKLTAEQIQEHADAMAELDPIIQQLADDWGILNDAQFAATAEGQRVTEGVMAQQSALENARQDARDFAIAMGTDVVQAYAMSDEELLNHIRNMKNLPPTFETVAEASQRAAEEHLEGWVAAYDEIREAQEEWASTMTDALDTVGDEFGEELEGIGTDSKEKFKAGIAFDEQFWNEAFPQGMARAAFDKNVDIEDIIEDTKDLIDSAVEEGLITEEQAEESFYPFINWMEQNLPEDTRAAMAMLNAMMPELMAEFGGTIVDGIGRFDRKTEAAFNKGVVAPAQRAAELGFGPQGVAQSVVENMELLLPKIEEQNPEFFYAFQKALVDPLTQQERPFADQIQRLFDIFVSMGEAGKPMVEALDRNTDGTPDVLEDNIISETELAKNEAIANLMGIAPGAGTAGTDTGEAFKTGFGNSTDIWDPTTGLLNPLYAVPPAAQTVGSDSGSGFTTGWGTGVSAWNPSASIQPALDVLPTTAQTAGSDTLSAWRTGIDPMPAETGTVVQSTADEFGGLKDKLITAGSLIGIALNHIALKFTEWRDYVNGPMGLAGIGVNVNYGPLQTGLQVALSTLNINTVIGLGQIMASWMLHFQALNSYIPIQFGITTQLFAQYFPLINQATTQGLGLMLTTWINHFTALNAFVPTQLGITAQMFAQYLPLIGTAVAIGLGNVMISWVNHFTALNNYVNSTFPTIIGTFNTWMAAAAANVLSYTTFMSAYWMIHANSVSATVGTIAGHMGALASEYAALSNGVNATMSAISGYWITHASSLLGSVRMAVGHMVNYAREILALSRGINRTTSQMSGYWITHASSLNGSVNAMIRHLNRLASNVSSTMRRIVSSMRTAMAAANALRNAINRLQNKTITVTTRYRTRGRQGAARGFSGVVNRPTDIHAGEGGRPELVNITPLQGTPGARLNGLAAFRGLTPTRIGAANGLSPGSIMSGSSGNTTKTTTHTSGSQTTVRKQVISNASSSGQSSVMVSRHGGNGNPIIIDNHIILDSSEMKRWIRKVANEDYRSSR